jgi:tRNA(Ile)-lysidine synthase
VRTALSAAGWGWIDDPANDDLRYGRSRARKALQAAGAPGHRAGERVFDAGLAVRFEAPGFARLPAGLAQAPDFKRLLQMALLCVSGGDTPARGARVRALADGGRCATLGGCRVVPERHDLLIARELGRSSPPFLDLPQGRSAVWDGRFEITAEEPGLGVRPLKGLSARLPEAERRAIAAVPAAARPSLPVLVRQGDQTVTCPFLAEAPGVRILALAAGRFAAACGLIAHEAAI